MPGSNVYGKLPIGLRERPEILAPSIRNLEIVSGTTLRS